jgi:dihydrolipoamide dehydrogenase
VSQNAKSYDVAILGAGPGGYVAAIRAAQLGKKVAIIEDNHLGGICLNWGCIPTKALLRASEIYHLFQHAEDYGFKVGKIDVDFKKIIARSRDVSKQLSSGIGHLMKKNKIEVIEGFGKFIGKDGKNHKLSVTDKKGKEIAVVKAPNVIIATGARARQLPGMESDGKDIWTYREAMVPEQMPKSLLIVGSGAIGIEFASFYSTMGAKVTVVEVMDRVLPVEDAEISQMAEKAFAKRGIEIMTKTTVKELKKMGKTVQATIEMKDGKQKTLEAEKVIMAVGVVANTENIGLEKTKVKVDRNSIVTDRFCQTAEQGVYAIGDVASAPWLAHKASHEGVLAAEHIAGQKDLHAMRKDMIPGCTYSMPQVASVGLTEAAAKEQGYKVKVGRFPYIANGKAVALGETDGLVKTIFDEKTGELLGAHMIGPEVTELIQGYGIARMLEATELELMQTIFPHPTLSEAMHESVLDAYGRALHY